MKEIVHDTRTSLTFEADATMCAESLHLFASSPKSSFSFRAWHDLVLADFLNISFMSSHLSLIRESLPYMRERQVPADPHLQTYSVSLLDSYTTNCIIIQGCRVRAEENWVVLDPSTHIFFHTLTLKYLLYSKRLELLPDCRGKLKNMPWGYLIFRTNNMLYAQLVCLMFLKENIITPNLICLGLPM